MQLRIQDTSLSDWQSFIDFIRSTKAKLVFYEQGRQTTLPLEVRQFVPDHGHQCRLSIQMDGITVDCYLSSAEEIVLAFDPRDIDNEDMVRVIFRLMSTTGRTLDKPVMLMAEDKPEKPVFEYRPGSGLAYLMRH